MNIDLTTAKASRSFRVGRGLARAFQGGVVVTLLALLSMALGAPLPLWLALLPAAAPLVMTIALFALVGFLICVGMALGGGK